MWKGVEYLAPLVVLAFAIFLGGKVDAFFPVPAIISSLRCVPQRSAVSWAHAADEDKDDQRVFWDVVEKELRTELGHRGLDRSRVWDFVRHNRDGMPPPPSPPPSCIPTGLYFPGLEARPWWDRSKFPWIEQLEAATPEITSEMVALLHASGGSGYAAGTGEMSSVYDATKGWGTMRIRYMGRYDQLGVNYELLPRTLSVLDKLPLAPETAAFQRQLPGTGLPLHVDPSNFVLGLHLGIVVPPGGSAESRSIQASLGETDRAIVGEMKNTGTGGVGFGSRDGITKTKRVKKGRTERANNSHGAARKRFGEQAASPAPLDDVAVRLVSAQRGQSEYQNSGTLVDDFRNNVGLLGKELSGEQTDLSGGDRGAADGDRERAWIEVAGTKREWDTGEAFVFDPSFLHRTHNPTSQERVILNVDIWHPGLADVEIRAIEKVCELIEQWNARIGIFQ